MLPEVHFCRSPSKKLHSLYHIVHRIAPEIGRILNKTGEKSMNYLGVSFDPGVLPALDLAFLPLEKWMSAFEKEAKIPVIISLSRPDGIPVEYHTAITGHLPEADECYLERCVKFLLWSVGTSRLTIAINDTKEENTAKNAAEKVQKRYSKNFDANFMSTVFSTPFTIEICQIDDFPGQEGSMVIGKNAPMNGKQTEHCAVGGHLTGCRIGFDAGGSDYKVAAVQDGRVLFSAETPWNPKEQRSPAYHESHVFEGFQAAAKYLPRVDAIGVSTAGVVVNNEVPISSLFSAVPPEKMAQARTVFARAAAKMGAPLRMANDGDVSALAAGKRGVLGLALGTAEAAGYVNLSGGLTGWLNELSFAPLDLCPDAPMDAWSGDRGVGSGYLSQDAVIRLAKRAGLAIDERRTLAEQLRQVQENPRANAVFEGVGCYLAHALSLYQRFYDIRTVFLQGRVLSGRGGEIILEECREILRREHSPLAEAIYLPDEKTRRVGQAVAAAGL
jgi:predicted NBD/HSP70 family sugar kinase